MEKIIEKFRRLTFKRINAILTDSEDAWLTKATKAIYGRFGRYPQTLSRYKIKVLSENSTF